MTYKLPWLGILALCGGLAMPAASAPAAPATQVMTVTPDQMKWADMGLIPGAQIAVLEGQMDKKGPITARIKLPADTKVAAHWHPGVERVTVLSGTFNYGLGDKLDPDKTSPFGPGSLIVMQPKVHHFGWTKEETVIQVNVMGPWGIHYVNPADDPRKKQ